MYTCVVLTLRPAIQASAGSAPLQSLGAVRGEDIEQNSEE